MEVDITAMRKDIINFLESEEAELSFGKKFLREVRTWYDDKLGGYIEAIQATQKVIGNVWRVHVNPVVGGVTDGVIDEIVGTYQWLLKVSIHSPQMKKSKRP